MSQLFQNEWLLLPERLAVHVPTRTGVVADLHLGYSETRRASGEAVPLFDSAALLEPLLRGLRKAEAEKLVVAGDLFERFFSPELLEDFVRTLGDSGITLACLVFGNHDRRVTSFQASEDAVIGRWRIVHGDAALPSGHVVAGHFHPCTRFGGRKVPCFLTRRDRLVLPAYSPDAAGVDLTKDKKWGDFQRWAIVGGKVVPVQPKSLRSARSRRFPEARRLTAS